MRVRFYLAVTLVAASLLWGCASSIKLAVPPAQIVDIEPGSLIVDGKHQSKPWDTVYHFKDGLLTVEASGFRFEPAIGGDLVGLEGSPWAGVRWFHVENAGLDFGFDRANFTVGADYLWRDVLIGPSIAFPYDLGNSHFELKAAFIF